MVRVTKLYYLYFFYPTVGPYIPPKELYNNGQDWETQTNLTEFAVNISKWYYWNQIWGGGWKNTYILAVFSVKRKLEIILLILNKRFVIFFFN